ncbi:MAG: TRADD-N-associated membrane domain-containing protein [Thiolinea sp.]
MATETNTNTKEGNAAAFLFKQEPLSKVAAEALDNLSKSGNVQEIASNQVKLLTEFYDQSLSQAHRSFVWALIASVAGLVFFMVAIAFQLGSKTDVAIISAIGGALIEFIAAVNFYLYGKTTTQLNLFHGRLEVTQRFLLANSLCDNLGDEHKDETRSFLIRQLAGDYNDDHMVTRHRGSERRNRRQQRQHRDTYDMGRDEEQRHPAAANAE